MFQLDEDTVDIYGCDNGVDWSVTHQDGAVRPVTETGRETLVPFTEYKKAVFDFAGQVEAFYHRCSEKKLPEAAFERNAYLAF